MQAGKLRHRLHILAPVLTQADDGAMLVRHEEAAVVWGSVQPLSARELMIAEQTTARCTHRLTLRYSGPLSPTAQIKMDDTGRTFELTSVRNIDERNRMIEALAIEKVA